MELPTEEKILVTACLRGDQKAQRSFYERFASKMFGVCLRFAKSREEAEDLLQEGFFKVFCDLPRFRGEGSLEGWVRRVVVNVALQHIRKHKMIFQDMTGLEEMLITDGSHEQIWQHFQVADLLKILHLLPDGCQLIFNLYVLEEYSHKEIAEQLNISIGTSKSQLAKARSLLKKQLNSPLILI